LTSNGATKTAGQRKRFKGDFVCPVCNGTEGEDRGQGTRCFGYLSGRSIVCTREDHAGQAPYEAGPKGYRHNAKGPCPCGKEHAPSDKKKMGPIDRVYKYHDDAGKVVFETVRFKEPKDFRQRRPGPGGKPVWNLSGVATVLYQLPELLTADPTRTVWIVEGEKDVDRLRFLGEVATCNPMGAGKWFEHYADPLRDRICRILPDNDQAGRDHAEKIARTLRGKAMSAAIVELPGLPNKGDVSDFFDAGGTLEQLITLAKAAPEWEPPKRVPTPSTNGHKPASGTIQDQIIVNGHGRQVSCLHNSLIWIRESDCRDKVRYDRFRHVILVDGRPLDDEIVIDLTAQIEASTRVGWSQDHVRSALVGIAHRNEYSSLTEWLDSLKWDGTPRLSAFFHDAYACDDTDYNRACAEVLFLSGVARAYHPGCQADVMVVLIGKQGIGKSMGIASLCPDPLWYADDLGADLFDKKAGEGLRGKWLIEFSEFSRINRATLDVAKAFVSRRSDHYRPAYGRVTKDFPRTCFFAGTTNDDHPLHDRENRRFMPIQCNAVEPGWIPSNRDQLWAEAVARYQRGDKWWVTNPEVVTEVTEKQEEARQNDFWEEVLQEKLKGKQSITMSEAAEALKIYNDRMDKSAQTRIGFALKSIGFTRKQVRNGKERAYEWVREVSPPVTTF
jgi:predicted P-loop ATPase